MHISIAAKTAKGTISIEAEVENEVIMSIKLGGDLFFVPRDAMPLFEKHMTGVELKREYVTNAVNVFYFLGVKSLNATKEELIEAIMRLKDKNAPGKI